MDFERYLTYLDQPVVILDRLHQVLTMNPAFSALFPRVEAAETLHAFTGDYPALSPLLAHDEGQFPLEWNGRHYSVHIFFVRHGRRGHPLARCILFTDETDRIRLLHVVERQSLLLRESNEQAQRQNAALEETIQLERQASALRTQTQLLRDIHDTLGHTLVMLCALHHKTLIVLPDKKEARGLLTEILRWAGISSAELEAAGDYSTGSFVAFLRRFRDAMAGVGLDIALCVEGEESEAHHYMYADLVRICQEAATNAIKHGRATRLNVSYRIGEDSVTMYVKDNGLAMQVLGNGFGLAGMEERVNNLFGDLAYGWEEDGGFYVKVDAPVIRENE